MESAAYFINSETNGINEKDRIKVNNDTKGKENNLLETWPSHSQPSVEI